jgi:DNA-binding MarR family transcriptional regulator
MPPGKACPCICFAPVGAGVDIIPLASELRVVTGRLIRRLRAEYRFPVSQASVLGRLDREGAQSIGEIALGERVRPQSMSQTVSELEADGLIRRSSDARDGRRILVELTAEGRAALEADRASRVSWLARAMSESFSPEEQRLLEQALPLLARLSEL